MVTLITATIVQMLISSVGGSRLHDRIRGRKEIVLLEKYLSAVAIKAFQLFEELD